MLGDTARTTLTLIFTLALALAAGGCGDSGSPGLTGSFGSRHVGFTVDDGEVTSIAVCDLSCNSGSVVVSFSETTDAEAPSASSFTYELSDDDATVSLDGSADDAGEAMSGSWTLQADGCPSDPTGSFEALVYPEDAPASAPLCGLSIVTGCGELDTGDPVQTTAEGAALHWPLDTAIIYDLGPGSDSQLGDVRAAFEAWGTVTCSGLTFEEGTVWVEGHAEAEAGHIAVVVALSASEWEELGHAPGATRETSLQFDAESGVIESATIHLNGVSQLRARVLREAGIALGLDHVWQEDNALHPDSTNTSLGEADEDALCLVYDADAPLCEGWRHPGLSE